MKLEGMSALFDFKSSKVRGKTTAIVIILVTLLASFFLGYAYINQTQKLLTQIENQQKLLIDKVSELEKVEENIKSLNIEMETLKEKEKVLSTELNNAKKEIKNNITSRGNINRNNTETSFIWPTRGAISSSYGKRLHPQYGIYIFHKGIDIAAPHGQSIQASYSGKVLYSGWKSGYGNTIILEHANGIKTLYGHASTLIVKSGQTINKGDIIAKVGSTGNSTGPHVHFEVHVNEKHINPLNYVKR